MHAPQICWWLLVPALAAPLTMAASPSYGHAQTVTASRLEQLKANILAERLRVDAQAFAEAPRIREELEALRDEVAYLLIAHRRGQPVADADCHAIETKLQRLRQELRESEAWPSGDRGPISSADEVWLGAEVDVRVTRPLSSSAALVEDRFEAATIADLRQRGLLLVPAGSELSGLVTRVTRARLPGGQGSLTVVFDRITVHGRTYAIDTTITEVGDADIRGEAERIVLGEPDTVLAQEGREVELSVGSVFRVRFQSPLELTER